MRFFPLIVALGVAVSACGTLAALLAPNRQILLEADAAELARRAESGTTADLLMVDSIDVIKKRAGEISSSTPVVTRVGQNRILLEISTSENIDKLKPLLVGRGRLEIGLVDVNVSPEDLAAGKAPVGTDILLFPDGDNFGRPSIAVRRIGGLKGDFIKDAQATFDPQTNEPALMILLNDKGAEKFADMTSRNVGKMLAIVYDGNVLSAPIVNEPILGGSVQISGDFTVESAGELAMILRSGRLPVTFRVIEEKPVN